MASAEASEADELTHARYVEDYLDCLENLPGDLQILLSRMLELDANFLRYDRQLDLQKEVLQRDNLDAAAKSKVFSRMRRYLAQMHDIGDDKLQLVQSIHDIIEKRARQLDIDFKNLRPKIEQENNAPVNGTTPKETSSAISQSNRNSTPVNTEKITRRGRRTRTETLAEPPDSSVLSENQSSNLPSTSNGNQKKTNSLNNTGRKKKRKVAVQQAQRDDSASDDADEPLYCLCNQISYGKMILCDNDSCSLEWFHFNCVSLTTKPKGKWYCPQCRGSKPNIMKSKAQFR